MYQYVKENAGLFVIFLKGIYAIFIRSVKSIYKEARNANLFMNINFSKIACTCDIFNDFERVLPK